MTYADLFEYISEHFDLTEFSNADQVIQVAKRHWQQQGLEFPGGDAEDSIRGDFEQFQQSLPYTNPEVWQRIQEKRVNDQLVADMLGSGKVMESLSDQVVQEMKSPRSEIMGIDMTEYTTTRESIIPKEAEILRPTFFTRIVNTFRNFFRRK